MNKFSGLSRFGGGALAGFTLAEVLVTLGIIGVVSAMTMPTLVKNHQRQVFVTQLHKVYNELSQAFEGVISDSNAVSLSESSYKRNGDEWFLRNYFKTVKVCSESEECFGEEYSNLNGTAIRTREITGGGVAAILSSGASVCLRKYNGGRVAKVIVDVNGPQEPNIVGRDLFDFDVLNDGTISAGDIDDADTNFASNCQSGTGISYGACMAKIINDGWKMDY